MIDYEIEIRKIILEARTGISWEKLLKACEPEDKEEAILLLDDLLDICDMNDFTKLCKQLLSDIPIYICGSLFLYECFSFLNKTEDESLHFVSGLQFGRIFTLDRLVSVELAEQSIAGAKGETGSTHETLVRLEKLGHKAHALFHSHPGNGKYSVLPSSTDLETQERYERGGYPLIGCIFSRDGWLRFFTYKREFEISIFGNGVEKYDEKTYKLTKISNV